MLLTEALNIALSYSGFIMGLSKRLEQGSTPWRATMEFKKYEGIGEYIFIAQDEDKWIQLTKTYRDYCALRKIYNNIDDYIKELLFDKLKEL